MKTNSPSDASILIQKIPSDVGIHRNPRKGTLNAPEKILEDIEFSGTVFVDDVFPDEFDLETMHRRIGENTAELLDYGKNMISVGGDHSISYPVLKELKEENPEMKLVWLDAHLDLKKKVRGHVSHDVVIRQLVEEDVFRPEEVFFVGITKIDKDEKSYLKQHDFNVYRSDEVSKFLREFKLGEQPVYLSIDIDVLQDIEGTGYRDGEISVEEAQELIENLDIRSADLVEVAPPLDDGETVEKAKEILKLLEKSITN